MKEMEALMEQLIMRIRMSNEYNQYRNLLQRVKSDEGLYARIGDYRRRSLWVQMQDGEGFIHGNNELQKEFVDLQESGLASEFLAAEHQYITMIRKLQESLLEGAELDTSFLEV